MQGSIHTALHKIGHLMHIATSATLADFPGDVLTVEEAGRVLGLSRSSAYDAVRRGDIPTIRIGKRLIVPKHGMAVLLGFADSERPAA